MSRLHSFTQYSSTPYSDDNKVNRQCIPVSGDYLDKRVNSTQPCGMFAVVKKWIDDLRDTVNTIRTEYLGIFNSLSEKIASIPAGPKGDKGDPGEPGEPGATSYPELTELPTINDVEVNGDLTLTDLGIAAETHNHDGVYTKTNSDLLRLRLDGDQAQYTADGGSTWKNFRNPVGTADQSKVLTGYTFANSWNDSLNGSMRDWKHSQEAYLGPPGIGFEDGDYCLYRINDKTIQVIPAFGHYGTWDFDKAINCNGTSLYNSGVTDGKNTAITGTWSGRTYTATNGTKSVSTSITNNAGGVYGLEYDTFAGTTSLFSKGAKVYFAEAFSVPQVGIRYRSMRMTANNTYVYSSNFSLPKGTYLLDASVINTGTVTTTHVTIALGQGSSSSYTNRYNMVNDDTAVAVDRSTRVVQDTVWVNTADRADAILRFRVAGPAQALCNVYIIRVA